MLSPTDTLNFNIYNPVAPTVSDLPKLHWDNIPLRSLAWGLQSRFYKFDTWQMW